MSEGLVTKRIEHKGNHWCVVSESGKNLGCGKTQGWAEKRLAQVEYFKHRKSFASIRLKHLAGKHNQKKHGHGKGHDSLGLQIAIDDRRRANATSSIKGLRLPTSAKTTFEIKGRTINVEANVAEDLQKVFGSKSKVTVDDIVRAYTGGIEKLPEGTTLNILVDYSYDNDELLVEGRIWSPKLKRLGMFQRIFRPTSAGPAVMHAEFEVVKELQGGGYGSEMFYGSEAAYKKMGVSEIGVYANTSVGGYAWARMGFEFDKQTDRQNAVENVMAQVSDAIGYSKAKAKRQYYVGNDEQERQALIRDEKDKESKFDRVYAKVSKFKYPYEFATFTVKVDGEERRVGKAAMLGMHWSGVKRLNRKSKATSAGYRYKRLKKGKKK